MPVAMSAMPVPSRFRVRLMSVSEVVRVIVAMRAMMTGSLQRSGRVVQGMVTRTGGTGLARTQQRRTWPPRAHRHGRVEALSDAQTVLARGSVSRKIPRRRSSKSNAERTKNHEGARSRATKRTARGKDHRRRLGRRSGRASRPRAPGIRGLPWFSVHFAVKSSKHGGQRRIFQGHGHVSPGPKSMCAPARDKPNQDD